MYKNISIKNFRGIKSLKLENFKNVNLFVGNNNTGKSTILEALFLITGPTNPQLPLNINTFRGFNQINEYFWQPIFNQLNIKEYIKINTVLQKDNSSRELTIKPNFKTNIENTGNKPKLNQELSDMNFLTSTTQNISGLILEYTLKKKKDKQNFTSHITLKYPGIEVKFPEKHREDFKGTYLTQQNILKNILGRFNNIQIRKEVDSITEILKGIEPNLKNLVLGDGFIYCDIGLDRLIPLNCMGDGMIRILSIILSIFDTKDGILFIDEVENGLHYSSQEILWKNIFLAAKKFNVQIFANTHSNECIRAFYYCYKNLKYKDFDICLYRLEREENKIKTIRYEHTDLEVSLEEGWEIRQCHQKQ